MESGCLGLPLDVLGGEGSALLFVLEAAAKLLGDPVHREHELPAVGRESCAGARAEGDGDVGRQDAVGGLSWQLHDRRQPVSVPGELGSPAVGVLLIPRGRCQHRRP